MRGCCGVREEAVDGCQELRSDRWVEPFLVQRTWLRVVSGAARRHHFHRRTYTRNLDLLPFSYSAKAQKMFSDPVRKI